MLTGDVARNKTSPSIVISILIAGIASALSGLCYAEFSARVPKASSAYVYSYVTIGEFCAFVIGWNLIAEYCIAASSSARAYSSCFDYLFDDRIKKFTRTSVGEMNAEGNTEYLEIALLTILMILGIRITSWFMPLISCINILVILFAVSVGACYAELKNWTENFMPNGFSGVMIGATTRWSHFQVRFLFVEERLVSKKNCVALSLGK